MARIFIIRKYSVIPATLLSMFMSSSMSSKLVVWFIEHCLIIVLIAAALF